MRLRVGSPSHSLSPSLRSKVSFIVILVILLSGLDGVIAPAQAVASTPCPLGGIQSLTDLNCHLDSTAVQTSPATFTCPSGYLPSGTNVVVSGVTPNCTSTYPATSIPSCPNTGGTLSTDGLTCSYPPVNQTVAVGSCPSGSTLSGIVTCTYSPPLYVNPVYVQVWNPPVTTTVVITPATTTQVYHPPVTTTFWNPSVQVWHPAVTSTTYVAAVMSCYYGPPNSTYYCVVKTPAHYVTTTTPGYYTTTPGYYSSTTAPAYYTTSSTPAVTTTVTTNGFYSNGTQVIAQGYFIYTYTLPSTSQTVPSPNLTSLHSPLTCNPSDPAPANGFCTSSATPVNVAATIGYVCPSGFLPLTASTAPQDCTVPAVLSPLTVPLAPTGLTVTLVNPGDNTLALSWATPPPNGSPITSYDVYWDGGFGESSILVLTIPIGNITVDATSSNATIPVAIRAMNSDQNTIAFSPGITHYFWVAANNAVGSSPTSYSAAFSTSCTGLDTQQGNCFDPVVNANYANAFANTSNFSDTNTGTAQMTVNDVIQRMITYAKQFLGFQLLLEKNSQIANFTPGTIAWATRSLYGYGAGHSGGLLETPNRINTAYTATNPFGSEVSWSILKGRFCGSSDSDATCENKLNSIVQSFAPLKSPLFDKYDTCNNVLALTTPYQIGGNVIYDPGNPCQLPFVDCSAFIDTVLTWALADARKSGTTTINLNPAGAAVGGSSTFYLPNSHFLLIPDDQKKVGDFLIFKEHIAMVSDISGNMIASQNTNSGIGSSSTSGWGSYTVLRLGSL